MKQTQEMDFSLVSKQSVEFFANMLGEIDGDTYALLRAATIPSDIHTDTDYEYLPESTLKNFFEVLAQHMNEERAGWLFLRTCREHYVPELIAVISKQPTLRGTLEALANQLQTRSTGAKVYLQHSANSWWLVRDKAGVNEVWFKYAEMFSVICIAEVLRALTNDQWTPARIGIQSQNRDDFSRLPSLEHAQFYVERPVTALEIPVSLLDFPVQVSSPNPNATSIVSESLSFKEQFTLAITPYLSMGKLPIKLAAEILRLNVRTLQRRLSAENIIYKPFIEQLVFDEVKRRLCETGESITQLANRFGYSDSAHFTRSFKRIVGVTPSSYRSKYQK
jgi:AraC-like DNA-binding protein